MTNQRMTELSARVVAGVVLVGLGWLVAVGLWVLVEEVARLLLGGAR